MRIRLLRAFFTLATVAVVWFVASPALAFAGATEGVGASLISMHPPVEPWLPASSRAPLCDPRGATMFAPPPQMQDVELSLDTGLTLEDCMSNGDARHGDARRAAPGRMPVPLDASASADAAVITAVATLAAAARELLPVPVPSTSCSRPGVRSTVDRPPRA